MSLTSILRINHDGMPIGLYRFDAQKNDCQIIDIKQWSDRSLLGNHLVILVPASWVYHSQSHVASKNSELLAKSIPFVIEEELSNDVEDNYFAFKLNPDGSQDVVAIEKVYLNQLKEQIKAHRLEVKAIHSEVDWLPVTAAEVSIWGDPQSALLKLTQHQAMRVGLPQVSQLLPVFAADKQRIRCNEALELEFNEIPVTDDLTAAMCCSHLINQDAVDLYLEEIKDGKANEQAGSWRGIKIMLALLVISWLITQTIQWYDLSQSIADIKQQQKNLLLQNYPNAAAAELVDPFAALQSRLQIKNAQATVERSMLINTVDKIGQTMRQQKAVKLMGLRLVDQKIELQILAPNMKVINDFHQLLQQHANSYSVKIGVNELGDDNTFKSILTVVPR